MAGKTVSEIDAIRHQPPRRFLPRAFMGSSDFVSTPLSRNTSSIFGWQVPDSRTHWLTKNEARLTAHRLARCGIVRRNAKRTTGRAGDPNDCHAEGYKSERRYFRRLVDLANGPRQRNSCRENGASASRHGGDGRNVVSGTCASGGYGSVLCPHRENRPNIDDHSGGGVGNALHDRRGAPRY